MSATRRHVISRAARLGALALLSACAVPPTRSVPLAGRAWRIGYIYGGSLATSRLEYFRQGLREVGRIEGTDIVIDARGADSVPDRLPGLIADALAARSDLLVTGGTIATLAAQRATTTTPIVFHNVTDPVAQGIVASLSHPGGNITGVAALTAAVKRLEMLLALDPKLRTVAVLWNANNSGAALTLRETEDAAKTLGLALDTYGIHATSELDTALDRIARSRPGAICVQAAFTLYRDIAQIPDFAASIGVPAAYATDADFAHAGGLVALGPNVAAVGRRAASLADRVLKGEQPSSIPVELPTQLDVVVNLRAAARIGLVIPASVLSQATEVVR